MDILLINPPRYNGFPVVREGRVEYVARDRVDTPATLLLIASLLKEDKHRVGLIDANAFDYSASDLSIRLCRRKIDCVIFPVNHLIIDHDLRLANIIKDVDSATTTIAYSWFARHFATNVLDEYQNLDIFVIAPVLSVVRSLIDCLSRGEELDTVSGIAWRASDARTINKKQPPAVKLDELPMPAYDLLASFTPYYAIDPLLKPYALIYRGKGCPFGCKYCMVARTHYCMKSTDSTMEELKLLRRAGNIRYVWFHDEVFTLQREHTIDLCRRIIEEDLNIKWFCDTRVELVDEELLKTMRMAGCIGISYGVESGSQKILDAMNKGNTVEQARRALLWTRQAHIPICVDLILGFIGEDRKTLEETEDLVRTTLPELVQPVIIEAKSGTEFTHLAVSNRWTDDDLDWKERIRGLRRYINHYEMCNLDLNDEKTRIANLLYHNPKWWAISLNTLCRNPQLILPVLGKHTRSLKRRLARQPANEGIPDSVHN